MSSSPDSGPVWAAVGPEALLEVLVPLRDEHLEYRAATLNEGSSADLERIASQLPRRSTLLVVEDPAEPSARSLHVSPFAKGSDGGDVVLGWLRLGKRDLTAYVNRAVALLQRPAEPELPLVLLGPRERRYASLLDEVERGARCSPAVIPFQWSAERLGRWAVVKALRHGPGIALFTGHGNADGWFAYGGLSSRAFTSGDDWRHDQTTALMLSLACRTGQPCVRNAAEPREERPGFADHLVGSGVAGVALAPLGDPLHTDNRTLATTIVGALVDGHRSCCDLLNAIRGQGASLDGYAVVGDPALRAASSAGATARCRSVFAPSPDAVLG